MEWPKGKERYCNQCRMEEVEDEEHFMRRCELWKQEKNIVIKSVGDLVGEFGMSCDNRKVALLQTAYDFHIASSRASIVESLASPSLKTPL